MKQMIAAVLLVLLLCGARATLNTDFNDANLPQLVVGETTSEQAAALLGRPADTTQVGQSGAIGHVWIYGNAKGSMWTGRSRVQVKRLTLVFNTDGTFQRILNMQGITLPPDDMRRLVSEPAAALSGGVDEGR